MAKQTAAQGTGVPYRTNPVVHKSGGKQKSGRKKRWYVQYYPNWLPTVPAGAVSHTKLPVKVLRVSGPKKAHCKVTGT